MFTWDFSSWGDTWEEVKTCAQGHKTDTVHFTGGVAGAGTERKEGRGFFLVARHCSQPRRGGRDGRRIFSQGVRSYICLSAHCGETPQSRGTKALTPLPSVQGAGNLGVLGRSNRPDVCAQGCSLAFPTSPVQTAVPSDFQGTWSGLFPADVFKD